MQVYSAHRMMYTWRKRSSAVRRRTLAQHHQIQVEVNSRAPSGIEAQRRARGCASLERAEDLIGEHRTGSKESRERGLGEPAELCTLVGSSPCELWHDVNLRPGALQSSAHRVPRCRIFAGTLDDWQSTREKFLVYMNAKPKNRMRNSVSFLLKCKMRGTLMGPTFSGKFFSQKYGKNSAASKQK